MTKILVDRSVLEQALEALETCLTKAEHRRTREDENQAEKSRDVLRAALAQQAKPRHPQCANGCEFAAMQTRREQREGMLRAAGFEEPVAWEHIGMPSSSLSPSHTSSPAAQAQQAEPLDQDLDWSLLEVTQSSLREHMAELRRLHAQNKALLDSLKLALASHGVILTSDPPQDAWKARRVEEIARAAIKTAEENT